MRTILVFVLLAPIFSSAQKIVEDKIDDFTNVRSISTDYTKIKNGIKFSLLCIATQKAEASDTIITAFFSFVPGVTTSLRDDSETIFKFNDGSMNSVPYNGKYHIMSPGDFSLIYATLDEDIIKKIRTTGISKIRLNTSSENIDFDFDKNTNEKFIKAIDLLNERVKEKKS